MHAHFYALQALDLAAERSREAERRTRLLRGTGPIPRSVPRGVLERLAAWLRGAEDGSDDRLAVGRGASA
jgi:hypothetical protein